MSTQEWAKHREYLVSAYETATRDFDRAIMLLAGGALGVSISFIDRVAPPKPEHKWLLGVAWFSFALSLSLILVSFLTSQWAIRAMIGDIDEDVAEVPKRRLTDALNWSAGAALVAGVGFLVTFALYNL